MKLQSTLSMALLAGLFYAIPSHAFDLKAGERDGRGGGSEVGRDDHRDVVVDRHGRGNPFRFGQGVIAPWGHWDHGPELWLADAVFFNWAWDSVHAVTCTAEDQWNNDYSVTQGDYVGIWYRDNMHSIEDHALDECYAENPYPGSAPLCHIADCHPY
jgi:hypothetical protein